MQELLGPGEEQTIQIMEFVRADAVHARAFVVGDEPKPAGFARVGVAHDDAISHLTECL